MGFWEWLKRLFGWQPPPPPPPIEQKHTIVLVPNEDPAPKAPLSVFGPDFIINSAGLALVKHFEGCYLRAYQDSVGVWTIGWGRINMGGRRVRQGDICTQAQADQWLMEDLFAEGAKYVRAFLKSEELLNENQFSALVSFTYNRGAGRFHEKLAGFIDQGLQDKLFDQNELRHCSDTMLEYDWAGSQHKVLEGLARRRWAERALFLSQDWTVFKDSRNWRKFAKF
jgi:lysozyme